MAPALWERVFVLTVCAGTAAVLTVQWGTIGLLVALWAMGSGYNLGVLHMRAIRARAMAKAEADAAEAAKLQAYWRDKYGRPPRDREGE